MTTAVNTYASKETIVHAAQWNGSESSFREIKRWAGSDIHINVDGQLLFQSDGVVDTLPIGNYLVRVGDYLHSFTPDEMNESYARVEESM